MAVNLKENLSFQVFFSPFKNLGAVQANCRYISAAVK
jgi:hypothetical protein